MSRSSGEPPRVAILGSPNVGKSTLFNRLVGSRRAITDAQPGVTRDSVEALVNLGGRRVLLMDTGGYGGGNAPLDLAVSERSLRAADIADLILLVIDVQRLDGNDREFVEKLQPHRDRVLLVVNKVDNDQRELEVWNLLELGFSRLVPVSATHGRNLDDLRKTIAELVPEDRQRESGTPTGIRLAIVGKPNTGKSTLLNRLLGTERALVSDIPGTTRDVIGGTFEWRGTRFDVVDTAGIRRRSKVHEPVEYYSVHRAIGAVAEAEVVLLLVDSEEGVTDQDKKIASLAVREGRGVILVLSKWDLMEPIPNRLQAAEDRVRFLFPVLRFAPVAAISAVTGENIDMLLDTTRRVHAQLQRRISTPALNEALAGWLEENPPSARVNIRVRYGTQVSANPLRFLFFANRSVPDAYQRFLVRRLRETFGLTMVPIDLEIRRGQRRA